MLKDLAAITYNKTKVAIFGTPVLEKNWANRRTSSQTDWDNSNTKWIEGYWESFTHPHRQLLLDEVAEFDPINSILEVGSNCGPNIRLLAEIYPRAKCIGIDINQHVVEDGNFRLMSAGLLNASLHLGVADDLSRFDDNSFDVAITDAVLMYVGPDKIEKVINEMLSVAKKGIVLLEFNHEGHKDYFDGSHWIRDYKNLFGGKCTTKKLPDDTWNDSNWSKYGSFAIVRF